MCEISGLVHDFQGQREAKSEHEFDTDASESNLFLLMKRRLNEFDTDTSESHAKEKRMFELLTSLWP